MQAPGSPGVDTRDFEDVYSLEDVTFVELDDGTHCKIEVWKDRDESVSRPYKAQAYEKTEVRAEVSRQPAAGNQAGRVEEKREAWVFIQEFADSRGKTAEEARSEAAKWVQ